METKKSKTKNSGQLKINFQSEVVLNKSYSKKDSRSSDIILLNYNSLKNVKDFTEVVIKTTRSF